MLPAIEFFAVPTSSSGKADLLIDMATTALTGARLLLTYTPTDISGSAFGCLASNCRTVTDMRLIEPGPYVMEFKIDNSPRAALIYPALEQGKSVPRAPVIFYFHGHTGTMWDSAARRRFHSSMPEAIVVYGQGSWVDSNGIEDPAVDVTDPNYNALPGWQLRFPYKSGVPVNFMEDIAYVDEILARLRRRHLLDPGRVFASGHSGGAFFTLSLVDLMPDVFAGFAALGAYSRYRVKVDGIELPSTSVVALAISEPWSNSKAIRVPLVASRDKSETPRPVLYAFGQQDTTFDNDSPDALVGYVEKTPVDSRARQTIEDLRALNGCSSVTIQEPYLRTILTHLPAIGSGEPVFWWPYEGAHSFPEEANDVFVKFFRDPTRHPVAGARSEKCTDL